MTSGFCDCVVFKGIYSFKVILSRTILEYLSKNTFSTSTLTTAAMIILVYVHREERAVLSDDGVDREKEEATVLLLTTYRNSQFNK